VCVLVEHQTRTDVLMPFRTLFLTVAFWDASGATGRSCRRRARNCASGRSCPSCCTPGDAVGSTRRMTELLAEPAAFTLSRPN